MGGTSRGHLRVPAMVSVRINIITLTEFNKESQLWERGSKEAGSRSQTMGRVRVSEMCYR